VDFFFIDGSGVVSLGGEPEKVVAMLGAMLEACQHFFLEIYNLITDYAEPRRIWSAPPKFFHPASRTFGLRKNAGVTLGIRG